MTPCILCDIDGTLANNNHRQGLLKSFADWDKFFAALVHDKPILPVIDVIHSLVSHGKRLHLVTGRPERYRSITKKWLSNHGVFVMPGGGINLYMRKDNDHRPDDQVKADMITVIKSEGFSPYMAIDDRETLIPVWRKAGMIVLQVHSDHAEDPAVYEKLIKEDL